MGSTLELWKSALLRSVGFALAVIAPAFAIVPILPIHAQILHASAPLPSFEVATIRPLEVDAKTPASISGRRQASQEGSED